MRVAECKRIETRDKRALFILVQHQTHEFRLASDAGFLEYVDQMRLRGQNKSCAESYAKVERSVNRDSGVSRFPGRAV